MGLFGQIKEQQKELKNKKAEVKDTFKAGGAPLAFALCEYLGGHPDVATQGKGILSINQVGLLFEMQLNNNAFFMPISGVIKAEFKTDEQISKDVTLTRLLAFGVFAFGMKKKTKEVTNYLIVTFRANGVEGNALFESKIAGKLVSAILKAKQLNPTNEVATETSMDIPEQIKKLSELKDAGILSEAEFQNKKVELLARM